MCITGCAPKRAGQEFFNDLENNSSKIKEIAKKHKVVVKLICIPIKSIIKNEILEKKALLNWVNELRKKVNIHPKKLIYQGAFVLVEPSSWDSKKSLFHLHKMMYSLGDLTKINLRWSLRRIAKKESKQQPKNLKMIQIVKLMLYSV